MIHESDVSWEGNAELFRSSLITGLNTGSGSSSDNDTGVGDSGSGSGNSGSMSASSSASTTGSSADDVEEIFLDDVIAASIQHPLAIVSTGVNVTNKSIAAFLVTLTFLVANNGWLSPPSLSDKTFNWALFRDDKIRVKRITFSDVLWLLWVMIIEMERAYKTTGGSLITSQRNETAFDLRILDPGLLSVRAPPRGSSIRAHGLDVPSARVAPASECEIDEGLPDQDAFACLRSPQLPSIATRARPRS